MAFYNVFLNNSHGEGTQKLLVKYNINILKYLIRQIESKEISLLEIGVGKGYFKLAVDKVNEDGNYKIKYTAMDRNEDMLKNLETYTAPFDGCAVGNCPEMKELPDKKYDIIYSSFLIEHLNNGHELYTMIENCKKHLNPNGIIVFLAPDAMKQKFEFYNIDYTHIYPTTKRNVSMAFYDNDLYNINIIPLNGICTYKNFNIKFIYLVHRFFACLYSYRFWSCLLSLFYRRKLWDLNHFFYRLYCFAKEENLMFIAKTENKKK
jgi:SAM-dependent methyltransferase